VGSTPTAFQDACLRSTKDLLAKLGLTSEFDYVVDGQIEDYFVGHLVHGGKTYHIYIYQDDAGFGIDERWFAYEQPDYDSPERLQEAFLRDFEASLSGSLPPSKNEAVSLRDLIRRKSARSSR
jgi:hypothetical protein